MHFGALKQINALSDGTRLLVALLLKMLSSKNELILIEEPENSLHPKALVDLIYFFRSFEDEKQFFLNTHSIALINIISPENVIVANCENSGRSVFSKVTDLNELNKKLRKGHLVFSDAIFFEGNTSEEENIKG
jgi:predicted ATPase